MLGGKRRGLIRSDSFATFAAMGSVESRRRHYRLPNFIGLSFSSIVFVALFVYIL
jgi:hypothetical protein